MSELPVSTIQSREEGAEAFLGHHFERPELLSRALKHRSAVHGLGSNERLEFIGDRVLGLLIAEWLVERFPEEAEGSLGPRFGVLVAQPTLAEIAETGGLARLLDVGVNEAKAGVRRRATVLADAMEAVIGALFLDAGLPPARAFVRRAFAGAIEAQRIPPKDPKAALQEWAQARGLPLPHYAIAERQGPPHQPIFTVHVELNGAVGSGTAGTKREAEERAAHELLGQLLNV